MSGLIIALTKWALDEEGFGRVSLALSPTLVFFFAYREGVCMWDKMLVSGVSQKRRKSPGKDDAGGLGEA